MPALNPVKGTLQAINHGMVKFTQDDSTIRMWGRELTVSDTEDQMPRPYVRECFVTPKETIVWIPNGLVAHLRNGGDKD